MAGPAAGVMITSEIIRAINNSREEDMRKINVRAAVEEEQRRGDQRVNEVVSQSMISDLKRQLKDKDREIQKMKEEIDRLKEQLDKSRKVESDLQQQVYKNSADETVQKFRSELAAEKLADRDKQLDKTKELVSHLTTRLQKSEEDMSDQKVLTARMETEAKVLRDQLTLFIDHKEKDYARFESVLQKSMEAIVYIMDSNQKMLTQVAAASNRPALGPAPSRSVHSWIQSLPRVPEDDHRSICYPQSDARTVVTRRTSVPETTTSRRPRDAPSEVSRGHRKPESVTSSHWTNARSISSRISSSSDRNAYERRNMPTTIRATFHPKNKTGINKRIDLSGHRVGDSLEKFLEPIFDQHHDLTQEVIRRPRQACIDALHDQDYSLRVLDKDNKKWIRVRQLSDLINSCPVDSQYIHVYIVHDDDKQGVLEELTK